MSRAIVETPEGRLSLRVGQGCAELDAILAAHDVSTWAYVTAFNPGAALVGFAMLDSFKRELLAEALATRSEIRDEQARASDLKLRDRTSA